jgi:Peptidyl-prolyl cis-trans isomerase (rotamase) - cyclophilin family
MSLRRLATHSLTVITIVAVTTPYAALAQGVGHRTLGAREIDAIARLEMMEDRRHFDSTALSRLLRAPHPEVRRRAALAVARLADKRGVALLRSRPLDADTAVAATTVFAVGQLRDTSTIAWFDSLLSAPHVAPTVLTEAAVALGKLKTAEARRVLARFLSSAQPDARTSGAIGEALLSIGRSTARGDLAPIERFTTSPSEELRWRATWALFRPRDPAAVPALLSLSEDRSGLVRSWAIRGLARAQADSAGLGEKAEARLLAGVRDTDRRVRTEALRALATYSDSAALSVLAEALRSQDTWISVTAAEGLARSRSSWVTPALIAATHLGHPCALRVTAMQALVTLSRDDGIAAAHDVERDQSGYCRATAAQVIARDTSRSIAERRADLASSDTTIRIATLRSMSAWADTSDLPMLLDLYDRTQSQPSPALASAAVAAIAGLQNRHSTGAQQFFTRFSPPENPILRRDIDRAFRRSGRVAWPPVVPSSRPLADYRAIVERWVVPAYNGRPNPVARWETNRGAIDLELYPGEAPLAVDYFVQTVKSGNIVGTEFTRVVADFVDQQQPVRDGRVIRDEVNRYRLTRANLSWATAGLDTGSPGYTLNHTPQPHNEGDFTSMGRVVRGMDVVDRIELGDRVTGASLLPQK